MPNALSTLRMNFGGREAARGAAGATFVDTLGRQGTALTARSLGPSASSEASLPASPLQASRGFRGDLLSVLASGWRLWRQAPLRPPCCRNDGAGRHAGFVDLRLCFGFRRRTSAGPLANTVPGRQRPLSFVGCPDGQGAPQAPSCWPRTRLRRTSSGLSIGSVALTRSVTDFIAIRLDVVHRPLTSPL